MRETTHEAGRGETLPSLPDTLREALERSIELGGGGYALIRLPDGIPVASVETFVKQKGGFVDHFRRLSDAEIAGGKRWQYGIFDALNMAFSLRGTSASMERVETTLLESYPSDTVRVAIGLLSREKPCTSILISPDPGTELDPTDGTFFALLQARRDPIFQILRDNDVHLYFVSNGEKGYAALYEALRLAVDLWSIRDLPIMAR